MTQLPIIKLRKLWFTISLLLVAASIAAIVIVPPRFGIDFTGGSMLEVDFTGERPAVSEISEHLNGLGYNEVIVQPAGEISSIIRLQTIDEPAHQALVKSLNENYGVIERRFENVGPTVGNELKQKAVWSTILVLLGIALYITYAFRKVSRPVPSWKYGLTTIIVGLGHDVLIPIGAFAVAGHFALAEVNSSFIAAILTVLGFSVHDTIVVYDRVRENLLKSSGTFEEVLERSVNETLARSINTTMTTIIPMVAIYFLGGESLRWFAFTLIVGMISGAYSSVFLCSPLLLVMGKKTQR